MARPCKVSLHRKFQRVSKCALDESFGCYGSYDDPPNATVMWVKPPCRGSIFACNRALAWCAPLTRPYDDWSGRTNCSCALSRPERHELNARLWAPNARADRQGWLHEPSRGLTPGDARVISSFSEAVKPDAPAQLSAQLAAGASSAYPGTAGGMSFGQRSPRHVPLLLPAHVTSLTPDGTLAMPPSIKYVMYEIGCSDRNTLDDASGGGVLDSHPDAFLIQMEPLLEKYAALLARAAANFHGSARKAVDRAAPLGQLHPRAVVLPLAVSEAGGLLNFSVARTAGCSSLLPLNPRGGRRWAPWCLRQLEQRLVPSITLAAALALSGSLPVRHLKLDVQGVDFQLVRSVPPALLRSKVETLEIETRAADCEPLYVGQPPCPEVIDYFRRVLGYRNLSSCPSKFVRNMGSQYGQPNCERDIRFVRQAAVI